MSTLVCCVFCKDNSSNIYEINGNSILIEKDLVDIDDLIYDLFMARTDFNASNYICEDCKDLLVQFYIFKSNARKCLPENPINLMIDQISDFTMSHKDKDFDIKCSDYELSITVAKPIEVVVEEDEDEESIMYMECDENELKGDSEYSAIEEIKTELPDDHESDEQIVMEDIKLQCECGENFEGIRELQAHTATAHKKKSNTSLSNSTKDHLICCDTLFKDPKYLRMHKNAHESFNAVMPMLSMFQCNECSLFYSNELDLEAHNEMHKNGTLNLNKPQLLERPSAFEDHFVKKNVNIITEELTDGLTCGHCGKIKRDDDMKTHLFFFHTTAIECPLENRLFDGNKQMRLFIEHVKNKHPEIFEKAVEYICTYCNERFESMFDRLKHMKDCDAKKFICISHCGKRFRTEWLLNKHIQQVKDGENRYQCSMCPKSCVSKSDLQIHMRSHTNERPYVCTICDKAFKTSANRSSHMDIHREEKVHECEICAEKFQTRPILRKHKKKHDAEYQNQCICKICNNSYINRTHLLRHIKSGHSMPNLTINQIETFFEEYFNENFK